ncbi:MAG: sigma-70 family RNA polymerase sigma factor [Pedobacter sp.]|nr:MAG: sigma-70 family RNA polymerase sigma factor [Pedobacter sp.]
MDEKNFLNLISLHQGIIYKVCKLYRDVEEDREDLFQEIVFQLWRSIDSFRGASKTSTFIYRVALNTAIASFRREKKRIVDFTHQLPEQEMEVENDEQAYKREQLMYAIKQLGEADRAIMILLLEDMSYREIAEVIGTNENNIAVKINRIKQKIKNLLIK